MRKRIPISDRLWARVDKSGECWLWLGWVNCKGYGQIGREGGPGTVLCHRLAYELAYGPIPAGLMVLHACDTPACVRPDHLRVGTAADNTADMMNRLRNVAPRALANGRAKLSDAAVASIRADHAAGKSCKQIARERHLHSSYVGRIVRQVRRA